MVHCFTTENDLTLLSRMNCLDWVYHLNINNKFSLHDIHPIVTCYYRVVLSLLNGIVILNLSENQLVKVYKNKQWIQWEKTSPRYGTNPVFS